MLPEQVNPCISTPLLFAGFFLHQLITFANAAYIYCIAASF
jgi:hypothetical protein